MRRRDDLLIMLLLAALATTAALWGWTWRLDRLVYDVGLALSRRPPPPGVVIVAIDDASVEAIGRWPWPRAVHATLLRDLALAQPRAVALDLVLSEPDADPNQDRLLADSLAAAAPVVLPVAWQTVGVGGGLAVLEPIAPLRAVVSLGAAEAAVDFDGVLRHAFLHTGPTEARYPHLALALLEAGGEAPHVRLAPEVAPQLTAATDWSRQGRVLIRYTGPPGTVDRVSYVDVLRGTVPAERLKGRYVLVGMTARGLGDTLATPVNGRHQAMSGVEVLANTIYTLRSGDTITELSPFKLAALSAGLLAALILAFGSLGVRVALPTAIASVPLAVAASLLALRSGLWCSPVPYSLAALLAYPLWSWRRLERTVLRLDLEIERIVAEPLVVPSTGDVIPTSRGDALEARLQSLQRAGVLVREARRFLAEALAAMPTAMLVGDAGQQVVLANSKAAALFDVASPEELQGLALIPLLSEFATAQPVDWTSIVAKLHPGDAGIAVETCMGSSGNYVLHVAAVEFHESRRLIVTIADIEPVKQAQRERDEVLAFVSHDLRSPASSIVMLADMNLRGGMQMPRDELLGEVRRLATRTLGLADDFVRAAHVQTQVLQRSPVQPSELIEAALSDLRAQAVAAEVNLQVQISDTNAAADVDGPLLVRAIGNLVSNAIKHSPRGSAVELHASVDAALLRIAVRDHGPGLTAQQIQQLAQGDQGAAVHDARGVGLGLMFVQRVARRHGGTLHARAPVQGKGALFALELPV